MIDFYVFLGHPGAGKGTQAKVVAYKKGIPQISSGDLFRENIKNQTDLGTKANEYIKLGELVPDDITIGMVEERISRTDCAAGAIAIAMAATRGNILLNIFVSPMLGLLAKSSWQIYRTASPNLR